MIEFQDATRCSIVEFAEALNRCFEEYVISIQFTPGLFAFLLRVEAIDPMNTILAMDQGEIVGILMVTRRGDLMRVGAMAIAKEHRGQGLGRQMMLRALKAGHDRGETRVILEAIEHNTGAIAFYEQCGFHTSMRLISAEIRLAVGGDPSAVKLIPFSRLAFLLLERGESAWTWDMSPATVMQFGHPIVAYEYKGLAVALHPSAGDLLLCRSIALTGVDDAIKFGELLSSLAGIFPGRIFRVPVYYPEPEFRDVLVDAGLQIGEIFQIQMERSLL